MSTAAVREARQLHGFQHTLRQSLSQLQDVVMRQLEAMEQELVFAYTAELGAMPPRDGPPGLIDTRGRGSADVSEVWTTPTPTADIPHMNSKTARLSKASSTLTTSQESMSCATKSQKNGVASFAAIVPQDTSRGERVDGQAAVMMADAPPGCCGESPDLACCGATTTASERQSATSRTPGSRKVSASEKTVDRGRKEGDDDKVAEVWERTSSQASSVRSSKKSATCPGMSPSMRDLPQQKRSFVQFFKPAMESESDPDSDEPPGPPPLQKSPEPPPPAGFASTSEAKTSITSLGAGPHGMGFAEDMEVEAPLVMISAWDKDQKRALSFTTGATGHFDITDLEDDEGQAEMRLRLQEDFGRLVPVMLFLQHRVVRPNNGKRLAWDIIGAFCIIYDIIVIPLQLVDSGTHVATTVGGWITRLFWTLDCPSSFFTGFLRSTGDFEMYIVKIGKKYTKTWLPLDLVIIFIDWLDLIVTGLSQARSARMGKTVKVVRMLRIARILRIAKLPSLFGSWTEQLVRSEQVALVMSILKLLFLIVCMLHLMACCWIAIGDSEGESSWIVKYGMDEVTLMYKYWTSFHWALCQFVGTMEVVPHNLTERSFAVMTLLAAFAVSAAFVSSFTSSMTRLNILAGNDAKMFSDLRQYLIDKQISRKLTVRVQRNATHALQEYRLNSPESEIELMQMISDPLRMEVHFEMYMPILAHHPFFEVYAEEAPTACRKVCHQAISESLLSVGDVLFVDGEMPNVPTLFFMQKGSATYLRHTDSHTVRTPIEVGMWVSEAVCWCSWIHRGVFRAGNNCQVLRFDAAVFQRVAPHFITTNFNPCHYAATYVALLNRQMKTDVLSDLDNGSARAAVDASYTMNKQPSMERASLQDGILKSLVRRMTVRVRPVLD